MKNKVTSTVIINTPLNKIWEYISDFGDASHQTIAVMKTNLTGNEREVIFKNGHIVNEKLEEKVKNKYIKWSQNTSKGFIPIKNVENIIELSSLGDNKTQVSYSFLYDTKMGPMGMMMNILMVKGKLKGYADLNLKKISKKIY